MRGQLDPACYTDPAVFESERQKLFARLWVFAGLDHLVAAPDGYFTREIAGRPIVVQNMDGVVRAFDNVCLHRGKLIQVDESGKRPLVCGYHGWRYGNDGAVTTIPFESECYGLDTQERKALRLREYAVRIVGSLVFVNLSEFPLGFDEQFSPALQSSLASASSSFDDEYLVARWTRSFNWKLAYENLRDMIHPRFVHTTSLNLSAKFAFAVPPASEPDPGGGSAGAPPLAELSTFGAEGELVNPGPPDFADWVNRWGDTDAYFNWLLFPNTHLLTSDGGYSFSIEHHHPISPSTTEITAYYMTARKKRPTPWLAPTLWQMAKEARRILDEDTDVMEQVQRALGPGSRHVVQGRSELQNRKVDRWYSEHVLTDLPSRPDP